MKGLKLKTSIITNEADNNNNTNTSTEKPVKLKPNLLNVESKGMRMMMMIPLDLKKTK